MEAVDRAFDLGGCGLIKAPRGVPDHVGNVDVVELPRVCLSKAKDHLEVVALRRVWRVEHDVVVSLLGELDQFVLVDWRIVHQKNVGVGGQDDHELVHVGREDLRRDRPLKETAELRARVADGADAAQRKPSQWLRPEMLLSLLTPLSCAHVSHTPVGLVDKDKSEACPLITVELLHLLDPQVLVLLGVCSRASHCALGEEQWDNVVLGHQLLVCDKAMECW